MTSSSGSSGQPAICIRVVTVLSVIFAVGRRDVCAQTKMSATSVTQHDQHGEMLWPLAEVRLVARPEAIRLYLRLEAGQLSVC